MVTFEQFVRLNFKPGHAEAVLQSVPTDWIGMETVLGGDGEKHTVTVCVRDRGKLVLTSFLIQLIVSIEAARVCIHEIHTGIVTGFTAEALPEHVFMDEEQFRNSLTDRFAAERLTH